MIYSRLLLLLAVFLDFSSQNLLRVAGSSSSSNTDLNAAAASPQNSASIDPAVQQAIQKCRDKLLQDPDFPKAQHMLAMLLESIPGSPQEEIADLSWRAGSCKKDDHAHALKDKKRIDALVRAAKAFKKLGQVSKAMEAQRRAILLVDNLSDMEELLTAATPDFVRFSASRGGDIISVAGLDTDNAGLIVRIQALAEVLIERFPQCVVAHQFQGAMARTLGDREAAYQAYHHATTLIPPASTCDTSSSSEENHQLSISLLKTQIQSNILASSAAREAGHDVATQMKYLTAAQALLDSRTQSMDENETQQYLRAEVFNTMGVVQKAVGNKSKAIEFFQSALEARPGDGHASAQLASLDVQSLNTGKVKTLDADYVQGLFDGYSVRFEDELVNTLEYQGHKWVAHQVVQSMMRRGDSRADSASDGGRASPIIVDLGCGTGLVGEFVRSQWYDPQLSPIILGVDLSERMVAITASREYQATQVYDSVVQSDAVRFLEDQPKSSVSAIVAADVFVYIGDLEEVLKAGATALIPAGEFVFSVELSEQADDDDGGMLLLRSGRFGHSASYIEQVARKAGFEVILWDEGSLRKQRGDVVRGAVIVLRKQ